MVFALRGPDPAAVRAVQTRAGARGGGGFAGSARGGGTGKCPMY